MAINKHCIWIVLLISSLFNTGHAQNPVITGELVFDLGSETICQGTLVQLNLELDVIPNSTFYQWSSTGAFQVQDLRPDIIGDDNGGSGSGDEHTFIRIALDEPGETTITVDIQQTKFSKTITVVEAPDAGQEGNLFLCNKTGIISLFDELGGTPDTGGSWTYEGSPHSGDFVVGTDEEGIYTYLVTGQGPCPDTDARIIVRNCSNPDYDNDGVPNEVDLDDDNDGILDADENAACSPAELTPTQSSVDEDFGIGPPTQNTFVSSKLTYQIGIPQDVNNNDGEYNVATATYMYNFGNQSAFWVSTDENNFWDGDDNVDGRFLSINMKTASFVDEVIYEQTDLPVTPGVLQTLSMKVANLSTGVVPSFKLQIITSAGAVIEEVDSVDADLMNIDIWNDYTISFTPDPGVEIVTLRLINTQSQSGNGNDVGIDNILLARLECDSDLDGVPNYIDRDSDNDGIFDAVEAGFSENQIQADGQLTGAVDANGVPVIANGGVSLTNDNYLNLDSDGDGCSDANEAYFDAEADGTLLSTNASETQVYGVDPFDFADVVDFDGLILEAAYTFPVDNDNDGVFDYIQAGGPDLNGNSIPDACEDSEDHDEDGVPDGIAGAEDLDDDNDGILDEVENGGVDPFADTDNDGVLDYMDADITGFTDVNADGIDDKFDTDLDGIINQFDLDSDNDGIYDVVEAGGTPGIDGMAVDDDDNVNNNATDGIPTSAGSGTTPINTQANSAADYVNLDSDADLCSDANEAYADADADGGDATQMFGVDSAIVVGDFGRIQSAPYSDPVDDDGNSVLDFQQIGGPDKDLDGIPDACDLIFDDNDEDGFADAVDLDDDNDGILDEIENVCTVINTTRNTDDYNVTVFEATSSISNAYSTITGITNSADISSISGLATAGTFVYDEFSNTGNSLSVNFAISQRGELGTYGVNIGDTSEEIALLFAKTITADEEGVYDFIRNPFINIGSTDRALDNFVVIYLNGTQIYASEEDAFANPNGIDVNNLVVSEGDVLELFIYELDYYNGDLDDPIKMVLGYSIGGCDSDNDGIVNQFDLDSDNDGIYDYVEAGEALIVANNGVLSDVVDANGVPTTASGGLSVGNVDGDLFYDFLDIDADGDGIPDNLEAQTTDDYTAPSGADANGNGVDDAYDGTNALDPIVTLGVGEADYININSDDDCLDDIDEAYDVDQDGVSDITVSDNDADNDGLDDAFDSIILTSGTSYTNSSGDSGLVATFPNNHDATTPEVDYREEFIEIVEVVDEPQILCASETSFRLFDLIETLTTNESGLWTGGIASTTGEVFDWDFNPSLVPDGSGEVEYVYTLPTIGTCPESTFTVTVEVIEQPFAGDDNLTATVCESETEIVLFDLLGGIDITENGTWTSDDVAVADLPTAFDEPLSLENIITDTPVSFTYTVGTDDCGDESIVTLTKTKGRNAGTAPTEALVFCQNIDDPTNLIDFLAGAETDGIWNDGTVDLPDSLGTIVPSSLVAGDYTYMYTLAPTATCEGASSTIEFTILEDPFAGDDNLTATVCESETEISLFDLLGGIDITENGIWTSDDVAVADLPTTFDGNLNLTNILIDTPVTLTYTVGTDTCGDEAMVTLTKAEGRNAGTPPTEEINLCNALITPINLIDFLTGAETDGTWNDGTVDLPDSLGTIIPNNLVAGDYIYTYTLAATATCEGEESIIEFTITPELNAGANAEVTLCREAGVDINLFDFLGADAMPGGTWISESGSVTFGDDTGALTLIDTNVLDEDRYTYTLSSNVDGGCEDATAFIDLKLTEDRDAGPDPMPVVVCTSETSSIDLFSELSITDTDGSWTEGNTIGGHLGTFLITDSTAPGDYTFTYTLPGNGTCEPDDVSVVLTVVTATVPTDPTNKEICEGEPNPVLSVTVDAGLSANWYDAAGMLVAEDTLEYTSTKTDAGGQPFTVRSLNTETGCESEEFVNLLFTIHGLPQVDLPVQGIVCQGETLDIPSGLSEDDFDFQWFLDGAAIPGATSAIHPADQEGSYHVEYTSKVRFNSTTNTPCSQQSTNSTRIIEIVPASDLTLKPGGAGFSDFNSITAEFKGDPNGVYEIDLDGVVVRAAEPNTPIVFENVSPGDHIVTVIDLTCENDFLVDNIFVIGFPKFFTPNEDGANDDWNVLLDPREPMDISIFVYDRFGKLIQQVFPDKTGWDGTFAGKAMPSDDYWFLATMNETGDTFASHFTLIR